MTERDNSILFKKKLDVNLKPLSFPQLKENKLANPKI